jgi:hypothetical protein
MHHPYNWLEPMNARAVRRAMEESSDIILTGHEHDFTVRSQRGGRGERNLYVEGCALHEADRPERSGFNVISIDTSLRQQRVSHFGWDGDRYAEDGHESVWEDYQTNKLRTRREFEPRDEMVAKLDDLGLTINHPVKGDLKLNDIFVFPDLVEVKRRPGEPVRSIRGEHLRDEIIDRRHVLLTGEDKSGKTCVGKILFNEFLDDGFVPLLIDGRGATLHVGNRLTRDLNNLFDEQYGSAVFEAYRQLPRTRRVLIVDDYHELDVRDGAISALVSELTLFADYVVLLSSAVARQLAEIVGVTAAAYGEKPFVHFAIQYYGHARRKELTERWFALDPAFAAESAAFARKLMDVKNMMDVAIGRNFVPALPVYMLAILQAHEHNQQVDVDASAYGYFYELLIRRALAEGTTHQAFDVKMGYLTFVAFTMFQRKLKEADDQTFREIHAAYEHEFGLPLSYADTLDGLLKAQILFRFAGKIGFKYGFIYYYFVAQQLAQHITEDPIPAIVHDLAGSIHEEDSANILLFLVHLSKHKTIIDQLLARAATIFATAPEVDFTRESSPLADLDRSSNELIYENKPAIESQDEVMRALDAQADVPDGSPTILSPRQADEATLAAFRATMLRYSEAFKTLQILGQVVKNFPGTMRAEEKRQVIVACAKLGLRTLGSLFALIRTDSDSLAAEIGAEIKVRHPNLTPPEIATRARQVLYGLTHLAALGLLKRISHAVGARALKTMYGVILESQPNPAGQLISISIALDQFSDEFPAADLIALGDELRQNELAFPALRNLVYGHLHLFEVDIADKQRVCAKLGISFKQIQRVNPMKRLVPGSKRK